MREGIIPTALGAAVTATGIALRGRDMKRRGMDKKDIMPGLEAGIIGFGLAHIVLGAIDYFQHD